MADDLNRLYGNVTDGGGDRTFTDPANANDGVDTSNATIGPYAAGAGTYHGYLVSDLGIARDVSELKVWGDVECGADPILHWSIESSDDGSSWTLEEYTASEFGTQGTGTHGERFVLTSTSTHRFWRVHYQTTIVGLGFRCGTEIHTWEIFGETPPTEPPVDPGYEPPDVGRAILEIYVHDEDASRWGEATWATGPATGTEGVWSAAGWHDVTPQGVRAHITWGASRPERGILAVQEAQSWNVETYDPDRKLDPGNADSPWAPQLVSGVPIRISNATSGYVIRTGVIDRIRYQHKAPAYRGEIVGSSTIAVAYRASVPDDAILGDTLRERLGDALAAAEIAIGGVPILASTSTIDNYPDLPLSPWVRDNANLWQIIQAAGEEVLWVIYEDNRGTLRARPWGGPLDRGREITYANLEDLESSSSEDGVYSVVVVQPADPDDPPITRQAAPLPRYGRIPYTRSLTTIDPVSWGDAVLADRAWPGITWTPGVIWCFDATELDYFSTLELMERVRIVVPGAVDVAGTLLGMELWVEQRDETRARWLFLPRLATTGAATLGTTTLVSDQGGDFLVDDTTGTDYLEVD